MAQTHITTRGPVQIIYRNHHAGGYAIEANGKVIGRVYRNMATGQKRRSINRWESVAFVDGDRDDERLVGRTFKTREAAALGALDHYRNLGQDVPPAGCEGLSELLRF